MASPKNAPKPLSRRAQCKRDEVEPDMPPLGVGGYIVDYLWMMGPTQMAGMGECVIAHQEIAAWQSNTGIELLPWEVDLLRRLSRAYLVEVQAAEDPYCPPPFGELYRKPNLDDLIDAALG